MSGHGASSSHDPRRPLSGNNLSGKSRVWTFTCFVVPAGVGARSGRQARQVGSSDESDDGGGSPGLSPSAPNVVHNVLSHAFYYRRLPNLLSPPSSSEEEEEKRSPDELRAKLQGNHQLLYYIFQEEECPSTKRRHWQGYIRFSSPKSFSYVKKVFLPWNDVHIEIARGTPAQNIAYCSKQESRVAGPWEFGDKPAEQGKRSDLLHVRDLVSAGQGMRTIAQEVTSYQGLKFAESLLKYAEPGRNFVTEVRWYHGSTGSGKTRAALEEFPDAWVSGRNLKWWDGYDAHEVVVVDDFRKDFCTFHELLRIFDRYPYRVETKGGSRQLLAKVIIVTCPWDPEVLFSGRSAEDVGQLLRRISSVKLFGAVVPPPNVVNSAQAANFVANIN